MIKQTASEARKDAELEENFQFGWTDGNQIINGIVMGVVPVPSEFLFVMFSILCTFRYDRL